MTRAQRARAVAAAAPAAERDSERAQKSTLVLYLEVFCFEGIDFKRFQDAYLYEPIAPTVVPIAIPSCHYLNTNGIFLFNQMVADMRHDKGFDVDAVRRNIFTKVVTAMGKSMNDVFMENAILYEQIWHGFGEAVYNDMFLNQLYLNAIPSAAQTADFINEWIIRTWRAPINACIAVLEQAIVASFAHRAFLVVVGGDAMRRYEPGISKTKDIDTKIYIDPRMPGTERARLYQTVEHVLSRFICEAAIQKQRIFDAYGGSGGHATATIDAQVPSVRGMEVVFVLPKAEQMQFRLRSIVRNEAFPVDLYSVDYRAHLNVLLHVPGRLQPRRMLIHIDIPILDVVIQENKDRLAASYAVQRSNALPVASLDFLLKDIQHIYTNKALANARIWGQKRTKDVERFNALRRIKFEAGLLMPRPPPLTSENLDAIDNHMLHSIMAQQPYHIHYQAIFAISRKIEKLVKNRRRGAKMSKFRVAYDLAGMHQKMVALYHRKPTAEVAREVSDITDRLNQFMTTFQAAKAASQPGVLPEKARPAAHAAKHAAKHADGAAAAGDVLADQMQALHIARPSAPLPKHAKQHAKQHAHYPKQPSRPYADVSMADADT